MMNTTDGPIKGEEQAIGLWLDEKTIAWPGRKGSSYRLYYAAQGGMARKGADVVGADGSVELTVKDGGLTPEQKALDPYITAPYRSKKEEFLALETSENIDVRKILTGQIAVMEMSEEGEPIAYSSLQTARVLDDLYACAAKQRKQGISFAGGIPTLCLWAPTAKSVKLRLYADGETSDYDEHPMTRQPDGSWTVEGEASWADKAYLYDVEVYIPPTSVTKDDASQRGLAGKVVHNLVTDPNSVGLTIDSKRSVIVDLDDPQYMSKTWKEIATPPIVNQAARSILEMHVRDFSATDPTVPELLRGTYRAFTVKDSHGVAYLRELARAGMNTIHLMPTYDFGSVPESRAAQATADVPDAGATSQEQQAAVGAVADRDAYNWGYDPFHYTTPEGSYALNPYGGARTAEYREMVGSLHEIGYQVVQDVVFNHTYAHGQDEKSVFEKIVPGYYHRLGYEGQTLTTPCCGEFATEHVMAEELMVNSLLTWAKAYKVDGFRFDLMEFISVETMKRIRAELDSLTLEKDGVDGSHMYLYGEGWAFGTTADGSRFVPSLQGKLAGTGIGAFNDRLRDAVHGSQSDQKNDTQGFGNGLFTDSNGVAGGNAAMLRSYTDVIRIGLAGNLTSFKIWSTDGVPTRGDSVYFNSQVVGYGTRPEESVNYVDAHDNETLFDLNMWKMPSGSRMSDRVRMNTLSLAAATLGQSPVFWHAGTDLLRSKSMDRNSYNSGDWFNAVDWSGEHSNFGVGLPPARDNSARWNAMSPYMSDPANKPDKSDIKAAHAQALDLLRLRSSTPLFTLGDAEAIHQKVTFPNSGSKATPGLLVMHIDDTKGEERDPQLDAILVVFNASPAPIAEQIKGMEGKNYELSEVQAQGEDEVVKTTVWDRGTGTITIPARTVAVLTLAQKPIPRHEKAKAANRVR